MKKLLAFVFVLAFAFVAEAASERPNFVIIMVDDMGYAGVSCFGNPYFKTPEIDRLAAEGMRLVDFHSSGTVCSPTRAGLLTGRYQQRAGIEAVIHPVGDHPEHRKGMQRVENTFAELLRQAGYVTGMVGKWHQGYPVNSDDYHPQVHGFDEFVGYHSGNIDFVSHVGDHVKHDWWHGKAETVEEGYSTHLINEHALDFIMRHGPKTAGVSGVGVRVSGKKESRPFCLYVAHEAIHNPVQVPGDPVRRSEQEGWTRWNWREHSKEERIEKYKGMTMPIDEGVGQIRRALEELGIERETFVMFFSDNGASGDFPSGSPELRGNKGQVYEGGHKVPCIAWWPGKIAAGGESAEPGITLDVMPTMLAMAGVSVPADRPLDGVDLSGLLFGKKKELEPRPLYWASMGNNGNRAEAMREGPWKVVVQHPKAARGTFENARVELFRLGEDGKEAKDFAATRPEVARRMAEKLKNWFAEVEKTATPQPGGWLAGEPVESLDAKTLEKDWDWVNELPKAWEWEDGSLRMQTQAGRVWARKELDAQNLLLGRGSVGLAVGEVAIEAEVMLESPVEKYEQGGLLVYGNQKNFVKLVVEHIEGEMFVVMAEEYEGKRKVLAKLAVPGNGARLKLVIEGRMVVGYRGAPGKTDWEEAGRSDFPVRFGAMRRWGLFTQDGTGKGGWATFSGVRY